MVLEGGHGGFRGRRLRNLWSLLERGQLFERALKRVLALSERVLALEGGARGGVGARGPRGPLFGPGRGPGGADDGQLHLHLVVEHGAEGGGERDGRRRPPRDHVAVTWFLFLLPLENAIESTIVLRVPLPPLAAA